MEVKGKNMTDVMEVSYYEMDEPPNLYRLSVTEDGIYEEVWRDSSWVDCSPALVGWLVDGRVNLEKVDDAEAARFAAIIDSK